MECIVALSQCAHRPTTPAVPAPNAGAPIRTQLRGSGRRREHAENLTGRLILLIPVTLRVQNERRTADVHYTVCQRPGSS